MGIYLLTCLILYTNELLFPRPSQRCPLLCWICHCTEHNHFPTIVILSSSEQEKHSSGSGKLFFFLPPIFVFAFLRSYISIASLQYNSVTSVHKTFCSLFPVCLRKRKKSIQYLCTWSGWWHIFLMYFTRLSLIFLNLVSLPVRKDRCMLSTSLSVCLSVCLSLYLIFFA